LLRGFFSLQVDAFTPYVLWEFVQEFPRVLDSGVVQRRLKAVAKVSLAVGTVFVAANVMLVVSSHSRHVETAKLLLDRFSRYSDSGLYWIVQFALSILALCTLVWKARRAPADERRRAFLLVGALVLGTAPTLIWVFLQAISETVATTLPLRRVGWLLYPTLLSTPFTIAYAVVVRRALEITLVIRRAVQYALARYSAMALAIVPVALLVASVYRNRDTRISQLLSSPLEILLGLLAGVGIFTLRRRSEALDLIDRRFFREQYDSRQILGQLVDRCRVAQDPLDLAEVIRTEVDRALHLQSISVLFLNGAINAFASPNGEVRSLEADSDLAALVSRGMHTVDVDLEHPSPVSRGLHVDSLHWLVDGGFRLLLPLRDGDRMMIGILALGEKKSELPFSREDKSLLTAVAAAAEMTAAFRGIVSRNGEKFRSDQTTVSADEQCAAECGACGAVFATGTVSCSRCGAQTIDCILPQTVGGKFRISERVGAGGMGVVYRGVDMQLGRLIAIKTLPVLAPEEAVRLRREARAMAAVSHPNLALIFGAETWRGRPMLVFEYLAGGTLTDRLEDGPMPSDKVVDLGIALSAVLIAIHRAGVLHRDIKPSNIGFTAEGTPKLLDFGLARVLTAVSTGEMPAIRHERDIAPISGPLNVEDPTTEMTSKSVIRGTLLYMSPEALMGDPPNQSFDIWSLCVALYEAAAGRNPLINTDGRGALVMLSGYVFPDIRTFAASAPPELADFFQGALSLDLAKRARTADQLHDQLWQLRLRASDSLASTPARVR